MTVIAALELHNIFSVGVSASQTDGRHGGFSARTDEAHFLDVGESRNYDFRQIRFGGRRCAKAGPIFCRRADRFRHSGRGVAQD